MFNKKGKMQVKQSAGITLVALVVTIVVLLILAGITINLILGPNSIFETARKAGEETNKAVENEQAAFGNITNYLTEQGWANGSSGNGGTGENPNPGEEEKEETLADLVTKTDFLTEPKEVKDINENKVVIPDGFRVLANGTKNEDIDEVVYSYDTEGNTPCVQDGIVIADAQNNQFVWIPVGTIYNKEKDENGNRTTTTITLGRYSSWGASPTVVQSQKNYTEAKTISSHFEESIDQTGENSHAANLKNFIDNSIINGGYWFGRYEASYGEGYNNDGSNDTEKYQNAKPLSVISKANSKNSMSYTKGTLWNYITQPNASIVTQNMKKTGTYKSDLINSYSWDTAIQFIEIYAKLGYANQKSLNNSLSNTGMNNDKQLNIHDMASNCREWLTENSTYTDNDGTYPCVIRGGYFSSTSNYTARRNSYQVTYNDYYISFRPVLYK